MSKKYKKKQLITLAAFCITSVVLISNGNTGIGCRRISLFLLLHRAVMDTHIVWIKIMSCDPIAGILQDDHRPDKRKYDKNIIK